MALNRPSMARVSGVADVPVTFKVISGYGQLRPGPNLDYFSIGLVRKGNCIRGFPFIISGEAWIKLYDEDAAIHVPDKARREDGVWMVQVHPKHGRLVQSQEEDVRYGAQKPGAMSYAEDGAPGSSIVEGGVGFGKRVNLRITAGFEEVLQLEWTVKDQNAERLAGPTANTLTRCEIEMVIDTASGRPPASGEDTLLKDDEKHKNPRPAEGAIIKKVDCGREMKTSVSNMPDGRYFLVSVVLTFDGQYRLRSRWRRTATLHVAGRDQSLGCTDPGCNERGKCEVSGCTCQGFIPMGNWSLNSSPTVPCRRCGCSNDLHVIKNNSLHQSREHRTKGAERDEEHTELPHEATSWDERERNLWHWSNGALHPRENPHAARRRQVGTPCTGMRGRVSVVCPTMEERQVFHEHVWISFISQTWPDKELIIIETYQTRSSAVFRSLVGDPRLIYLKFRCGQTTELSIGAKRNIAQHIATGDYIANFDDDDIYAPSYLSTMIAQMNEQKADFVTLSSWYFFDIRSGRFGFFDAIAWAKVKKMREKDIDGWLWGYGFSYVHRLQPALDHKIDYPNQNMEEDIKYIRAWQDQVDKHCTILHYDSVGIVLHTLHGRNTSNSFALSEVPREEVYDTDFAELDNILAIYCRMFPRQEEASKFIENEAAEGNVHRQYRYMTVHWLLGDIHVHCTRGCNAEEVFTLSAKKLDIPLESFRLHRWQPEGGLVDLAEEAAKDEDAQASQEAKVETPGQNKPLEWNPWAALCGKWVYGAKATEYDITMSGEGEMWFTGPHSKAKTVSGPLRSVGPWLQAQLTSPGGEKVGSIRLRYSVEAAKMISNFRSVNREDWGKDILAQRPPEPAEADVAETGGGIANMPNSAHVEAMQKNDVPVSAKNEPLRWSERLGVYTRECWLVLTDAETVQNLIERKVTPTHEAATGPAQEPAVPMGLGMPGGAEALPEDGSRNAEVTSPSGCSAAEIGLVVHIDASLNLREHVVIETGSTVGQVKEQLVARDLTGIASVDDFYLSWEGTGGVELSTHYKITGLRTELEIFQR